MYLQQKSNFLSYFILTLLMIQAGFIFFVGNTYLVIFTVLTGLLFLYKKIDFKGYILKYTLTFLLIMILQVIFLGNFLLSPFLGIMLRIIFAYMAVRIIGPDFAKYFVNFLYFFAISSLIFWVALAFIPEAYGWAENISVEVIQPLELYPEHLRNNLIIYTNEDWLLYTVPRNAGPFWEPGGYGVFLVIALLLNTIQTQRFINRKNLVFIFSIITTFSLGTYFAFLAFILGYLFFVNKLKDKKYFVFASFFVVLFLVSYNKYDFLGEKLIEREADVTVDLNDNQTYQNINRPVGRNEQLRLDLKAFFASPVFGEGQFINYKYGSSAVGLTAILRKWGILGFILIFGSLYFSFRRYILINRFQRGYIMVSVITFMSVSLTQALWGKPLFLAFSFLYLVLYDNYFFRRQFIYHKFISDKKRQPALINSNTLSELKHSSEII